MDVQIYWFICCAMLVLYLWPAKASSTGPESLWETFGSSLCFGDLCLSTAQIKIISYAISGCGLPTTCVVYSGLEMMVSCVAVSALAVNHHRVGEISDESVHHYTLEVPMGWSICISVFCHYRSTTERVVANGKSCCNYVLAILPWTAQMQ